MKKIFFIFAFLLWATSAQATNHYIRAGATGTTCEDWGANACNALPSTLIRGDTYYIADGSYASRTFNTAVSGTLVITIKKATVADHGISTGWLDTYGDGQAIFNSVISFTTSYWVFDGQTRNESDWFDGSAYGFQIAHNNSDKNITIPTGNNITVKYIYINALYGAVDSSTCTIATQNCARYAVDTYNGSGVYHSGLLFQRMFIRGSSNSWFIRTSTGTIVEYSAADGNYSNSANHGEMFNLYFSVDHSISRYNQLRNAKGTAVWAACTCGATGVCGPGSDYNEIYGNVVDGYCVGDGVIGYSGGGSTVASTNSKVYNNTFIDGQPPGYTTCWGAGVNFSGGSGNTAYNNLWVNWQAGRLIHGGVTHDYNAYSGASVFSEGNGQSGLTTSIFVDYAGGNFRLNSATNNGLSLPSYNTDLLGITRGQDGVWDRGAYEYDASIGACGSSWNQVFVSAPSTGLCSLGTAGTVTTVGNDWQWSCTGSGGTVVCQAYVGYNVTVSVPGIDGNLSCSGPVMAGNNSSCVSSSQIGFHLSSVSVNSGCTSYSWIPGNNYFTVGPVVGACTVTATFAADTPVPAGRGNRGKGWRLQGGRLN